MVAPGMPPPATPLPRKITGGLALSILACEVPSDAVAVCSATAQRFCSAVGSEVRLAKVPVKVTPARVGLTLPGCLGTGDSMISSW
ncbi:hypothetical protein D9M72_268110 [compost metagenome]